MSAHALAFTFLERLEWKGDGAGAYPNGFDMAPLDMVHSGELRFRGATDWLLVGH